jgi:hypothetical protein
MLYRGFFAAGSYTVPVIEVVAPPVHVTSHRNPAGHTLSGPADAPEPLALEGSLPESSGWAVTVGAFEVALFEPEATPVDVDGISKLDGLDKDPHPADAERPKASAALSAEKTCDLVMETSELWSASWWRQSGAVLGRDATTAEPIRDSLCSRWQNPPRGPIVRFVAIEEAAGPSGVGVRVAVAVGVAGSGSRSGSGSGSGSR